MHKAIQSLHLVFNEEAGGNSLSLQVIFWFKKKKKGGNNHLLVRHVVKVTSHVQDSYAYPGERTRCERRREGFIKPKQGPSSEAGDVTTHVKGLNTASSVWAPTSTQQTLPALPKKIPSLLQRGCKPSTTLSSRVGHVHMRTREMLAELCSSCCRSQTALSGEARGAKEKELKNHNLKPPRLLCKSWFTQEKYWSETFKKAYLVIQISTSEN